MKESASPEAPMNAASVIKSTLVNICVVIVGFLVFATGSSAIVLLLFRNRETDLTFVNGSIAAIGLLALGSITGLLIGKLSRARIALWSVTFLIVVVTTINVAMDVAIEPFWYKATVYLTVLPGLLWSGCNSRRTPVVDPVFAKSEN